MKLSDYFAKLESEKNSQVDSAPESLKVEPTPESSKVEKTDNLTLESTKVEPASPIEVEIPSITPLEVSNDLKSVISILQNLVTKLES